MEIEASIQELEDAIGYTFQDKKHLLTAMTHKSYVNEKTIGRYESYERYEFLGDAILEFVVSKYLFIHYKNMPEGKLAKLRSSLVCEFTLSKIARELHSVRGRNRQVGQTVIQSCVICLSLYLEPFTLMAV